MADTGLSSGFGVSARDIPQVFHIFYHISLIISSYYSSFVKACK